jgi:hypothetical protein
LDEEEIVWSESEQKTSSEKKTVLPLEWTSRRQVKKT